MEKKIRSLTASPLVLIGGICLLSFLLFFPSLFNFFSHDDFFHLKISQVSTLGGFLNFFNLFSAPEGFGFYRPLTTQVFYFLDIAVFKLNPLPLHILSFLVFFADVFLVYKLTKELLESNKVAVLSAFFYATSATHFGQLYYLGAFQELGLAFFYFFTVLSFVWFLQKQKVRQYLLVLGLFIGALLSKEFAVTLPLVLGIVYLYLRSERRVELSFRKLFISLVPFLLIVFGYLYLHVFYYGLAKGDSYIWVFSTQAINTIFWYVLWSLNIPEMLVDFIGPGLRPLPNLFKFYGREIIPILGLFSALAVLLLGIALKFKKVILKDYRLLSFSLAWFLITLAPVIFLPWHKFAYELTVPLFGVVMFISWLLSKAKGSVLVAVFAVGWLALSVLTNVLTYKTHWITQGGKAAQKTFDYINATRLGKESETQYVVFYDSVEDNDLPWKPSGQMKNILSGNNFFDVFYKGSVTASYGGNKDQGLGIETVKSRDLLGY